MQIAPRWEAGMRPFRSPGCTTAAEPTAVAILSALQWSIRLFRARPPLQAKYPIAPRPAPLIDRQYLAYLRAIDIAHCTNCSHGEGLLSCFGGAGLATRPARCPLGSTPGDAAKRLPFAIVTELGAVEHDPLCQPAQVQVEWPTRDARERTAADIMSHLGP